MFPADLALWEAEAGQPSITVVVKTSFRLVSEGEAEPLHEQIPILDDVYFEEGPRATLRYASDRVPLKLRTDFLVVGHVWAPKDREGRVAPIASLAASAGIGDFSKTIVASGRSSWVMGPGGPATGAPLPFERVPLRYELGTLSSDNPVGWDPNGPAIAGAPSGPQLAPVAPATAPCFGPVSASWRPRRRLLATHGRDWVAAFETHGCWLRGRDDDPPPPTSHPLPRGFDFRFFNAAPPDQQITLLRPRAQIELCNLHPDRPLWRSTLPPVRPQAFYVPLGSQRGIEVVLRCDTVWIDADQGIVSLVWRGITDVSSLDPRQVGDVYVVADLHGARVKFEQVGQALRDHVPIERTARLMDTLAERHDAVRRKPTPQPGPWGAPRSSVAESAPADAPLRAAPPVPPPPRPLPPIDPRFPEAVPIERYAVIAAELALRRPERAAVLAAHGLDEPTWAKIHAHHTAAISREAARGEGVEAARYDEAYVETLARLTHPIDLDAYVAIAAAAERGEADIALRARGLTLGDLARIQRVWRRRAAADPDLGERIEAALAAARRVTSSRGPA